jgi:shikimate 5-dehydrogenase
VVPALDESGEPGTIYFLGVSTGGSRIHALFPQWMAALGIDARIQGVDLPLDAPRDQYRDLVERIARDPTVVGAVITAHKLGVYDAAHTLFEETDRFVRLCHEVSAIAKRDGKLLAAARDPIAAGSTLEAMLGSDYWLRHQADVLCLGAGGAATAIGLCLLGDPVELFPSSRVSLGMPRRVVFVDIDPGRLDAMKRVVGTLNPSAHVEYLCHARSEENDAVLRCLPPASLVINATGMGKDRPGSPLTDRAAFPDHAVVWDLNYRGALTFLAQAHAQQERQHLSVHGGWLYFLHGWAQALTPILDVDLTPIVLPDRAES